MIGTIHQAPARKFILQQAIPLGWSCAGLVCFVLAVAFINLHWPFRYRNVEPLLQRVFASEIKIERYHRTYFPSPGFVADGITLRRNSAPDLPPVGTVTHLRVEGRWMDLLLLRNRVRLVAADGLHVVIPPAGSAANKADFPPGSSRDFTGPNTFVEQLDLENARLDLQRAGGGSYSFPIRRLLISNLHKGDTVSYLVDMQIPQPGGRIQARGNFGPLQAGQLAKTAVSGNFTLTQVNLNEIHGLGGILSATGHFEGKLAGIEGLAEYSTRDLAVAGGHPTPVDGDARLAVNGLTGDITLHAAEVKTGSTVIRAKGTIAGSPKVTRMDLAVENGRVEDVLRPFLASKSPVSGPLQLHGQAYLGAAVPGASFFERLKMCGAFQVPGERFTNYATERELTAFAKRAQGLKPKQKTGKERPVFSDITAAVAIRNGNAYMSPLSFRMPGVAVRLKGDFNLQNQNIHMKGELRMHSDISHVTTGVKAWLLKPLAPFFKKDGAGAVVPIAVTGTADHPRIGQNILH